MTKGAGSVRSAGGVHRGRRIAVPEHTDVRPTSDKVRAALFNILGHRDWNNIDPLPRGARVLDAFAGTGALGIEALSRGAAEVLFLERDTRVRKALERTLETLDEAHRAYVVPRDATKPGTRPGARRFDLVMADAPYGSGAGTTALAEFLREGWLAPYAVAVVELDGKEPFVPPAGLTLIEERGYGNTRLVFLQAGA